MNIFIIGLNHRTAPVEIREKLAFPEKELGSPLLRLLESEEIREGMLLSTCNRTEIIAVSGGIEKALESTKAFLAKEKNLDSRGLQDYLYVHVGANAVSHLFRVASGMDSMVVGEPQILAQVKSAYSQATDVKACGIILNKLLHRTFEVAKKVRSETGIAALPVSVASVAVDLARQIFERIEGRTVLLLGAGEMVELAAQYFIDCGVTRLMIANRTRERAEALTARFGGSVIPLESVDKHLPVADIVLSSIGGLSAFIDPEPVRGAIDKRGGRPIFFIDIAVPRNVHPKVNELESAYVYDIDDLKRVADKNTQSRHRAAAQAESIIDGARVDFNRWMNTLDVVPTIRRLREWAEEIARGESEKTLRRLRDISPEQQDAIRQMARAIVNKMLHRPMMRMKDLSGGRKELYYIAAIRQLFDVNTEEGPEERREEGDGE